MTPDPDHEDYLPGHTLPAGTRLRGYRIDKVLGEGGFGIVYLAFDTSLERRVAIKEYLPNSMAARATNGATVVVRSPGHAATFAVGLRSFVNEARLLARFDHRALVKVHQFWEDNGTAYMVMPYYEGPTLKTVLANLGRLPSEAEVRQWLLPLMDALAVLHAENCFHRDVAPDNILITAGGPLLLDFGAARRVIGDATHTLTAVLKPGYAPIEQYGEMPGMGQGPWTDIFALASVLYSAVGGVKPVPSVERLMEDRMKPLSQLAAGRFRPAFLAAVDKALALRPEDRPRSIAEFRALLDAPDAPRAAPAVPPPAPIPATTVVVPSASRRAHNVDIGIDLGGGAARTPATAAPRPTAAPISAPSPVRPPPTRPSTQAPVGAAAAAPVNAPPRRTAMLALAAGAAAVLAYGAYRMLVPRDPQEPIGQAPADPTPLAPTPAPAPTHAPAPTAAPAPAPAGLPPLGPAARPSAPFRPASRPPGPFGPQGPQGEAARARVVQARCAAIRQKALRETLTAGEVEFLRRECR